MAMKERTGRQRVSKADDVSRKISPDASGPSARTSSRVRPQSKMDQVARKIDTPAAKPAQPARVRPESKMDQIARKIDTPAAKPAQPARVRPESKMDQIGRKIPSQVNPAPERPVNPMPVQPSSRMNPTPVQPTPPMNPRPTAKKSFGCCALPFVLGLAGIIGALVIIF